MGDNGLTKKMRNRLIGVVVLLTVLLFASLFLEQSYKAKADKQEKINIAKKARQQTTEKKSAGKLTKNTRIKLDVPLVAQLEEPSLINGCEVSSLAMVLQYNGIAVSKNDLAAKLPRTPLEQGNNLKGNPTEAFVGSMTGAKGEGYSVYSQPMIILANKFITPHHQVKDLTGKNFSQVLEELLEGNPVWVITTIPFKATDDLETWQTASGEVVISWNVHSVVVTGFDSNSIYLNDPYGEKKQVDRKGFIESWVQMGSYALTVKTR